MRTAIVLAGLNFVMLCALIFTLGQLASLRSDIARGRADTRATLQNNRAACERANGLRDNVVFLLQTLDHTSEVVTRASSSAEIRGYFAGIQPQFAARETIAGVQQRDCAHDFPFP
jgi:hypothetical protein